MKMVTGAAYQHKTRFAAERFGISACDIADGASCGFEEAFSSGCISDYHTLVKRLLDDGRDPLKFTAELCSANSGAIVIMDEIGCGIIPLDKGERLMREAVGRAGCIIAENSDTVIRLCCGIPAVIKGGGL